MFELDSKYLPKGDQPQAIQKITEGFSSGEKELSLMGVTGSGKTFTMAHVIAKLNRSALILAHNKTLAAQLYEEFKTLFPNNAVEYFVSYYDYYQPEAYLPRTDTYIEKDLAINERVERMRLSATRSLIERDDVIIVSSVSCIYGLGLPEHYIKMRSELAVGQEISRETLLSELVAMQYNRGFDLQRGNFRVSGDVVEIVPAYEEDLALRIEFFGDEVEAIAEIDPLTGQTLRNLTEANIYPSTHHVSPKEVRDKAVERIKEELAQRVKDFEEAPLYKQRILERTRYDLELIQQMGHCKGIENYSRHFSERSSGEPPSCLLDYFPKGFITMIDESHQTLPQIRAMVNGDRARKKSLVDFGFRLPSAYDNRPLTFDEFFERIDQVLYVSATPGPFEKQRAQTVEQIIRPTGLIDPQIEILPAQDQVDDVMGQIKAEIAKGGRTLVTTLTKKMAEKLSQYLTELGISCSYLHSEVDTMERMEIIAALRRGETDCLVGINLLREGLDMPEVSLVAILDADKEGFLRSATALIQTCGRAARNVQGRVLMYADCVTDSMQKCMDETKRRRALQIAYNKKHKIIPQSTKSFSSSFVTEGLLTKDREKQDSPKTRLDQKQIEQKIEKLKLQMQEAAKAYAFEKAAALRDEIKELERVLLYY